MVDFRCYLRAAVAPPQVTTGMSIALVSLSPMSEKIEAEQLRRDIARYRYLRDHLRDAAMRAHLGRLIEEAEQRLAKVLST
jgi:hypothetical protein